MNTGSWDIAV